MEIRNALKAFLLFIMVVALSGCNNKDLLPEQLAEVHYGVISEEGITLTSDLPGRVTALVMSEVRPQVNGIILERLFKEGSDVVKGQVLYQIDPAIYQANYNTAKAALAEAESNVTALALREKRYKGLVAKNAISRQDLDNTVSEHGQARARIARAKAELESASINLAYTQIKAPVSGRIGASSVTSGALVTANQADPLAIIQQTEQVYVDIMQSSADTIRLHRALAQGKMSSNGSVTKVRLTLEDGSEYSHVLQRNENGTFDSITGDLLFSEITVGQTTGSVGLRAIFENPDGLLLPGMYVTATIEEGVLDNAVLVPQGCVLSNDSGGHFVYVLQKIVPESNTFKVVRREVVLGRTFENRWIVQSGLSANELFVVTGLQKALPGEIVKGTLLGDTMTGAATEQFQTDKR